MSRKKVNGVKNVKRIAKYMRQYIKESILAPLFKLLEVIFDLLVPIVIAKMIDTGAVGSSRGYIWGCFAVLLLMAATGLVCSFTAQFFAAKASVGFAASLRQAMFDHIQGLSFTELDTLGTDTLITRLCDDVNQVQNGTNMGLRLLLRSPFIVFGAMIMAFTVNARCAAVFAVTIPVLFAAIFCIMLISIPLFGKVQAGLDRVTALTRENLTGVRVIRAFCREKNSVDEFEESNRGLTALSEFVGRISALLNPLTYVLINIAAVILLNVSAVQVNIGSMTQGETVALYNYMLQIIIELIKLASLIITVNKSLACANRIADVLSVSPSMNYPESDLPAPSKERNAAAQTTDGNKSAPAIEFRNVGFTYSGAGAPSLSGISFSAEIGQTVGIIGGTGSGKSTLVSLIPRFYDATAGEVLLHGINIKDYTAETLRKKVGIVSQKTVLFRGSIRDNLKWGNEDADDSSLWEALELAQAKTVAEEKPGQLDFLLEQGGRNLSGGQRQRLSIARTLVKKQEILILDDSSSALDFATDAALRKAIHGLRQTTLTFLVSQRIAGIRQADIIIVLDNGNTVGMGTHEELMNSCDTYREIYFSQFPEERTAYEKNTQKGGAENE